MTITAWTAYAVTISLVLSAAAWLLERGLTQTRMPTRWVWLGALAFSVGLSAAIRFRVPAATTEQAFEDVVQVGRVPVPARRRPKLRPSRADF